jgi:hypothetical protein
MHTASPDRRAVVEITDPGALTQWDHKVKRVRDDRTEVPF